jgi:hypothetical protein
VVKRRVEDMKHAKGYGAYAKQDGLKPHDVEAAMIDGKLCCRLCSYPLAGKTYRVEVHDGHLPRLLSELRGWGRPASSYVVKDGVLFTTDTDAVDVATETFINRRELLDIQVVSD